MYLLEFLGGGLLGLTWWQLVVATLLMTHVTIAAVTIFLHRSQAHRALDLHPAVMMFFRSWLWLTTGMQTKEWVSIHRKHHAKCETPEDPHSPQTRGLKTVLLRGAELYMAEAANTETLSRYGHGTPDDWMERNVFSRYVWQGLGLMLGADLILFGAAGLAVWAIQMIWIPFGQAVEQVVRVRYRLGLHPYPGDTGPGESAARCAEAEGRRAEGRGGRRDLAGPDRQPLRHPCEVCPLAEADPARRVAEDEHVAAGRSRAVCTAEALAAQG
jgi:fatty-acid desaturase